MFAATEPSEIDANEALLITVRSRLFSTPIPDKLWHYTSIEVFQKIVLNKKVHATDVRYVNDREEFIHARKIVGEKIDGKEVKTEQVYEKQ